MIITSCPQRKKQREIWCQEEKDRKREWETSDLSPGDWCTFLCSEISDHRSFRKHGDGVCPALNKRTTNGDEDGVAAKPRPHPGTTKSVQYDTKGGRNTSENKNTPVGATLFLDKLSAAASAGRVAGALPVTLEACCLCRVMVCSLVEGPPGLPTLPVGRSMMDAMR